MNCILPKELVNEWSNYINQFPNSRSDFILMPDGIIYDDVKFNGLTGLTESFDCCFMDNLVSLPQTALEIEELDNYLCQFRGTTIKFDAVEYYKPSESEPLQTIPFDFNTYNALYNNIKRFGVFFDGSKYWISSSDCMIAADLGFTAPSYGFVIPKAVLARLIYLKPDYINMYPNMRFKAVNGAFEYSFDIDALPKSPNPDDFLPLFNQILTSKIEITDYLPNFLNEASKSPEYLNVEITDKAVSLTIDADNMLYFNSLINDQTKMFLSGHNFLGFENENVIFGCTSL